MPALDGRKEKILISVVEDYVRNAEPVSSQRIIENYGLKVSSATVRSELSSLDKSGHLLQPHTSAGRIPTDKGYRHYVDSLRQTRAKAIFAQADIIKDLYEAGSEMDSLIAEATTILSRLTNLVAFVNLPTFKESRLKHIDLIRINSYSLLMVLIDNTGLVFKKAISLNFTVDEESIRGVERILNERLCNSNPKEMATIGQNLIELPVKYRKVADLVMTHILNILRVGDRNFLIEGATNILLQPEFKNTGLARDILDGLKGGQIIADLLSDNSILGETVVRIGSENSKDEMKSCSVVFGSYGHGQVRLGIIGIIGPVRLDYVKSISAVSFILKKLNSFCSLFSSKREI